MSFVDCIIGQGLQKPSAPALSVSGRTPDIVTYGALNHGIANLCRRLSALGVAPGKLYGLHIADDLLYIAMMLALEYLGAATVIVADPERVAGWPIDGMFVWGRSDGWAFPVERIDQDWLQGDGNYPLVANRREAPDELCHVCWTSGSTGKPKGVPLTHRVAGVRAGLYNHRFGPEFLRQSRVFCSLGFLSGSTYNILNHTLSRGGLLCLPASSLDQTVRKFGAYKLQSMMTSPLFLAALWELSRKERKDFRSLEVAVSGGGMLRNALAENIRSGICNRLLSTYGTAETSWVASGPVEMLDLDKGETGFVVPGATVEIVDPSTRQPLSEG